MKRTFIILFVSLICLNSFSQKRVENPKFSASTASYVKITSIELSDTITALNFEVDYFPGSWINVSDKTFIQDSKGGKKLLVKRAEGITLNKNHETPASGKNLYTLYFPPLDKTTQTIDYAEARWRIFDIEVVPQKHFSIVPESLQGNWLRTDGSNEWVYGFFNNLVIYDNEFWDKVMITNKGKDYHVSLQKDSKSKELFVRLAKDNQIYIGSDPEKIELFSRDKTVKPGYVIKNDEEFTLPVFKNDTVVYKGYIKGYHPKMDKTGMVYVDDIISQKQNSNLITINPDGTFIVKCHMINPQDVYVRIMGAAENIYLEPGKTTVHFIDASEYTVPVKNYLDLKKRERKSLFMGDDAMVNADLQTTDSIYYFDYEKVQKQILDMDAVQYKSLCLDVMKKEQESLSKYSASHQISKKALKFRQLQIPYRAYQNILSFNMDRESAYRVKNKIPRDQREIPLVREEYKPDYFKFIDPEDLNNPISLVSGGAYKYLINRIQYADCVRPQAGYQFIALSDTLNAMAVNLSIKEQEMLDKLKNIKSSANIKSIQDQDTLTFKNFFKKYPELMSALSQSAYEGVNNRNLKQYFGLSDGLAKEIMFAQTMCSRMEGSFKPFTDADKKKIKENVKTDFIVEYLMLLSKAKGDEVARKIANNKDRAGYIVNETPKTEGDKLFDAIVQKYKGKVVFVDFWATWCGPCKSGIEQMKPLKEEFKGKDIVFVYLTNETSPFDTWNMMIPDIKGEHYRVKKDEWNYFASKFKISGIPHYVLVNKGGEVVQNSIYFASSNDVLRTLLNQHLK